MDYLMNMLPYIEKIRWLIELVVIMCTTYFAHYIISIGLSKLSVKAQKTPKLMYSSSIIAAIKYPLILLIWLLAISLMFIVINRSIIHIEDTYFVILLIKIGVVVAIALFLDRLCTEVTTNIINNKKGVDLTLVDATSRLFRISNLIISVLLILPILGYSVNSVIAFGGIGGLAVSFAARDLLANFFGGAVIYLDKPFKVGDWVSSPDRDIEGTVGHIGWRMTTIQTFDSRPLYVPNAVFNNIVIKNPERMTNRRINETIGICYDNIDQLPAIIRDVKNMIKNHEAIDQNRIILVNFNKFSDSSLDFFIYIHTKTCDWAEYHEVKQEILFKIMEIISGHNAQMAFPTTTININDDSAMPKPK